MSQNVKFDLSPGLIIGPILLSVYSQLIIKWRVGRLGTLPPEFVQKLRLLTRLVIDPWMITIMVVFPIAALAWFAAMTKYELSYAYPFVSLAFALVLILSAVFFHEALTAPKIIGVALVALGLIVGSQG